MTAKNRKTLYKYFKSGSMPSEDRFKHLIDSMLNMRDEGFEKTPQEGLKVAQLPMGKLFSFFENIAIESPIWSIKIDLKCDDRKLYFLNKSGDEILTLTPDGKVGINQNKADFELDVAGNISSRGRIGEDVVDTLSSRSRNDKKDVRIHANGEWQDVTVDLKGCNAFEIMAGVGKQNSGKYALLHAFALKTFNKRGKIVYHQAHYGSRCNRLKLRWKKKKGSDKEYKLQLKTGCAYDKAKYDQVEGPKEERDVGVYVKCYITKLWFDEEMKDCVPKLKEVADDGNQGTGFRRPREDLEE